MSLEKERKWSLHNDLKEKETELTLNREEKLKDIEQKVTKAKQMALEKANQARKVRSSDFRRHFYCFRVH